MLGRAGSWVGNKTTAAAGSSAVAFDPTTTYSLFEDFDTGGYNGSGQIFGQYQWASLATGSPVFTAAGTVVKSSGIHPGVLEMKVAAVNEGAGITPGVFGGTTNKSYIVGSGIINMEALINVSSLAAGDYHRVAAGIIDNPIYSAASNGLMIYGDASGSGFWTMQVTATSVSTTVISSTAVTAGWHHLKMIVDTAAASISFYVDGTQLAGSPISTNIPVGIILPTILSTRKIAGSSAIYMGIDYVWIQKTFSTAR